MNPGPCVLVTVTFNDTACAVALIPHCPVRTKLRGTPPVRAGGPYGPVNPFPRVSASRQGFSPTKCSGGVGTVSTASTADGETSPFGNTRAEGLHEAGAGQFSIVDCAREIALEQRKDRIVQKKRVRIDMVLSLMCGLLTVRARILSSAATVDHPDEGRRRPRAPDVWRDPELPSVCGSEEPLELRRVSSLARGLSGAVVDDVALRVEESDGRDGTAVETGDELALIGRHVLEIDHEEPGLVAMSPVES